MRGWLKSNAWDWEGAQKDVERAMSLGPNTSTALHHYAIILHRVGRIKEAITFQRKAADVEPLGSFTWNNLGVYLLENGQLEEARGAYAKALEISPENADAVGDVAFIDLLQGQPAKALLAMEKLPRESARLMGIAMAQHDLGYVSESQRALDQLLEKGEGAPDFAYHIASVYTWRGHLQKAFEWLDRAYARRDPGLRLLKVDPRLRNLRGDPRYIALLKKMNLPVD